MFSLRDIATTKLPQDRTLPEVVCADIARSASHELRKINAEITKADGKYTKMFKHYTNILDPHVDIRQGYTKKLGDESLYDIMTTLTHRFRDSYNTLPLDIDEGNEWYAYLEYMKFRVFPRNCVWMYDTFTAEHDNTELMLTIRGILQTVDEVPVPQGHVPTLLETMKRSFDIYIGHIRGLNDVLNKRYSVERVMKLQKKYVETYTERSKIKEVMNRAKNFYSRVKSKATGAIYK
jgi:hypothetical protein